MLLCVYVLVCMFVSFSFQEQGGEARIGWSKYWIIWFLKLERKIICNIEAQKCFILTEESIKWVVWFVQAHTIISLMKKHFFWLQKVTVLTHCPSKKGTAILKHHIALYQEEL